MYKYNPCINNHSYGIMHIMDSCYYVQDGLELIFINMHTQLTGFLLPSALARGN